MAVYKIQVVTGTAFQASSLDCISITLVGSQGEGQKQSLDHFGCDFQPGATNEYQINENQDLGDIIFIRLHKDPFSFFPEDSWFCNKVIVESPTGKIYHFPCYCWLEGYLTLEVPEGTASLSSAEIQNPILLKQRRSELKMRQEVYKWKVYYKGFPKCIDVESSKELDSNLKYSITKFLTFGLHGTSSLLEIKLKGFYGSKQSWNSLEDFRRVFWTHKTPASEYVS
ncbi:hypothetical protein NDU88_004670 [Pleurodeles waltl]|uniref:Uncharacterized protein n=1 Tax=Pleurodeles waltl TaxID=8319 RepID=A0AAV7L7D4_PLEWA|nr:hypothetical protein NDU88_004670 [Pleurodeles waltl]